MVKRRRLKAKYRKTLNMLILLFALVCLGMAIYSIINIINWKEDVDDNNKIQEEIEENITIIEPIEEDQEVRYVVDFETLKNTNKDTIVKVNIKMYEKLKIKMYKKWNIKMHNFVHSYFIINNISLNK